MGFVAGNACIWPLMPDWSHSVSEILSWSTEILQAPASGVTQHRSIRQAPRRSLTLEHLAAHADRRIAETLLAGWGGTWLLPIWPDVQWLATPIAAGASRIACATAGVDFLVGGRALLFDTVNTWEVVTISAIDASGITLAAPTTAPHAIGSRLFPLRQARVRDGAEESLYSDDVGRRSITFDIIEPCDFPPVASLPTYLGHPVIDRRPQEGDNQTSSFSRLAKSVDYDASLPYVHDMPARAFRTQRATWMMAGREDHTWLRGLLYALQGRRVPMWLPSGSADLMPSAAISGTTLRVAWAAYSAFASGRDGRRDVRIELYDGRVFYRRITSATDGSASETLVLSSALDASPIDAGLIRQISYMALVTLASDDVEIEHVTDATGICNCTLGWQQVVSDV